MLIRFSRLGLSYQGQCHSSFLTCWSTRDPLRPKSPSPTSSSFLLACLLSKDPWREDSAGADFHPSASVPSAVVSTPASPGIASLVGSLSSGRRGALAGRGRCGGWVCQVHARVRAGASNPRDFSAAAAGSLHQPKPPGAVYFQFRAERGGAGAQLVSAG